MTPDEIKKLVGDEVFEKAESGAWTWSALRQWIIKAEKHPNEVQAENILAAVRGASAEAAENAARNLVRMAELPAPRPAGRWQDTDDDFDD